MEQLIPQAKPSRREIGEYRRRYVTVTHPEVVACGHKFSGQVPNQSNCYFCWESWFKLNPDLDKLHQILSDEGPKGLEKKYGSKVVKAFKKFLQEEFMPENPRPDCEMWSSPESVLAFDDELNLEVDITPENVAQLNHEESKTQ